MNLGKQSSKLFFQNSYNTDFKPDKNNSRKKIQTNITYK
jgi:hypothetical protein